MLKARRAHATIYNNGFVYVFGGAGVSDQLSHCERYNLQMDKWEEIGNMQRKRELFSACNFGSDFIYLFGGFDESF